VEPGVQLNLVASLPLLGIQNRPFRIDLRGADGTMVPRVFLEVGAVHKSTAGLFVIHAMRQALNMLVSLAQV
jgi:hypothetical protein